MDFSINFAPTPQSFHLTPYSNTSYYKPACYFPFSYAELSVCPGQATASFFIPPLPKIIIHQFPYF